MRRWIIRTEQGAVYQFHRIAGGPTICFAETTGASYASDLTGKVLEVNNIRPWPPRCGSAMSFFYRDEDGSAHIRLTNRVIDVDGPGLVALPLD